MPTYQYVCTECGGELEAVQKFTDAPLTVHDEPCGGRLRKVFSPVGVVFKGSGFYRNDSRNGSSPADSSASSESSSPDSSKSDSSAAKKTDSPDSSKSSGSSDSSAAKPAAKVKSSSGAKVA